MERIVPANGRTALIYRIGATMYRDPGLEQFAHDTLVRIESVNGQTALRRPVIADQKVAIGRVPAHVGGGVLALRIDT